MLCVSYLRSPCLLDPARPPVTFALQLKPALRRSDATAAPDADNCAGGRLKGSAHKHHDRLCRLSATASSQSNLAAPSSYENLYDGPTEKGHNDSINDPFDTGHVPPIPCQRGRDAVSIPQLFFIPYSIRLHFY